MNYQYLAILGRQPELGLMELESIVGSDNILPLGNKSVLIKSQVNVEDYGGIVKVAKIIYEGPATDLPELPIDLNDLGLNTGKTTFAISSEGRNISSRDIIAMGVDLKRRLKSFGSARFISPKAGTEVTAAQLKFNRVLEKGFELILIGDKKRLIIAQTIGIQDIDWYSRRDYDRPAKSAKVGMLPPKLAKVLVNTTQSSLTVDPFCGTGVVLQESLLLGREAIGSDLSYEMVIATNKNLKWLQDEIDHDLLKWDVFEADARSVKISKQDISIVSEGYLGPNLSNSPSRIQLDLIMSELRKLYCDSLINWAKQIQPGTELALCVPAWNMNGKWVLLGLVDDLARLGYTVKVFKHVQTPVLYSRAGQVVGRQLLLLRKI